MKKLIRFHISILCLSAILFSCVPRTNACAYDPIVPVFSFEVRPEDKLEEFVKGNLGILKPNYARSYLAVAYKILNGYKFSEKERADILKLWKDRLEVHNYSDTETREDDGQVPDSTKTGENLEKSIEQWLAIREKVIGQNEQFPGHYNTWRTNTDTYAAYLNCNQSSFDTATKTLADRRKRFGINKAEIREWVNGQDIVFSNCNEGKSIPSSVGYASPVWLQKDREYQIAASLFYSEQYNEARVLFERIASDRGSVWRVTANYMIARTFIRQSSAEKDKALSTSLLEQAENHLSAIIDDPTQKDFHSTSRDMLGLISSRYTSETRLHKLALAFSKNAESNDAYNELNDYTTLLDIHGFSTKSAQVVNPEDLRFLSNETVGEFFARGWSSAQKKAAGQMTESTEDTSSSDEPALKNLLHFKTDTKFDDISKTSIAHDLTDWVLSFQASDIKAFRHSYSRWETSKREHWLVAAISQTESSYEEAEDLLTEAQKIVASSPAYLTVSYHAARILIENGQTEKARRLLDQVLNSQSSSMPISAKNNLYSARMYTAKTLEEFYKFAQRKAVAFSSYALVDETPWLRKDQWEGHKLSWRNNSMFDRDSVEILNEHLPLSMIKKAAESQVLPDYLKKSVLIAAWTRACLLEDEASKKYIAFHLSKYAPELSADLSKYVSGKTGAEKATATYHVLLKYPVMRPYVDEGIGRLSLPAQTLSIWGDNWWYQWKLKESKKLTSDTLLPPFIETVDRKQAQAERQRITTTGVTATFLAGKAIEIAKKSPSTSEIPEMLHNAVRVSRSGDTDERTGEFSRTAFSLLHRSYSTTEWARKTPYWYHGYGNEQSGY